MKQGNRSITGISAPGGKIWKLTMKTQTIANEILWVNNAVEVLMTSLETFTFDFFSKHQLFTVDLIPFEVFIYEIVVAD